MEAHGGAERARSSLAEGGCRLVVDHWGSLRTTQGVVSAVILYLEPEEPWPAASAKQAWQGLHHKKWSARYRCKLEPGAVILKIK